MADPARRACTLYIVDAFTDEPFRGNSAAVCLVPADLDISDDKKQQIAAEMSLSETAYIEHQCPDSSFTDSSRFNLRWFTPTTEVPLCGHATLASTAALIFGVGNTSSEIEFSSKSGPLIAKRVEDSISLNFPLNPTQKPDMDRVKDVLKGVCEDSEKIQDVEYSPTTRKLLVRLPDDTTRAEIEAWPADPGVMHAGDNTGYIQAVILTVKGSADNGCMDRAGHVYDFVSRFFAPWLGIAEDPVTGAAHTVLADYWRKQLGKTTFYARQCSRRGGELHVGVEGDRVTLTGRAQIVLKGELYL